MGTPLGVDGTKNEHYGIVSEFPHQFVQKLPNQLDITERDNLELEVMTGEEDADVKWFKDGHEVVLERKRKQT